MTIDVAFGKASQLKGQILVPLMTPTDIRLSERIPTALTYGSPSDAADNVVIVKANMSLWLIGAINPVGAPGTPAAGTEQTQIPMSADETLTIVNPAAGLRLTWKAR
jgi:hypothetical protein